jgi:hypothetical protein
MFDNQGINSSLIIHNSSLPKNQLIAPIKMLRYTTVSSRSQVDQMLALQAANHPTALDEATRQAQGFVTVRHDPEVLWAMNQAMPSIIALDGDTVAGYCLAMPRSFRAQVPILEPMFALLDGLTYRDKTLADDPTWLVMGQVCVAESHRGQGLFDGMYHAMRDTYCADFQWIITEISKKNTRSLRAHERVGFDIFYTYDDPAHDETWCVVAWEWE